MAEVDNGSVAAPASASEALSRAETAASSAAPTPAGGGAGDTPTPAGAAAPGATADATSQPGKVEPAASAAAPVGEAPQSRIEAAVRNARAEVERQFSWAKGLNPQEVQEAVQWMRQLRANPQAFAQQLSSELKPATPEPEEAFPEPDYTDNEGKAKFYSADTLRKAMDLQKRQILAEVNKGIKPIMDERAQGEVIRTATNSAREAITEARKLEHFKENEPAISEVLAAMDPQVKQRLGPVAALYTAYSQVLATTVTPGLRTKIEEEIRQGYAKKAAASVGAHPHDAGGGNGKAPELSGPDALAKHMEGIAARLSA